MLSAFRKPGEATLKAGTMRSETLRAWLDEDADAAARKNGRTVLVHLRDEHGPEAGLTLALRGARIIKHISGRRPVHVITIEDPMEFLFTDDMSSISQRA